MSQQLQPVLRPGSSRFINALVVLFSLLSAPAVGQAVEHGHQQDRQQDISEDNVKRHLTYSADCEININSLEYFDFTGDGVDEAVVVASTCATGTAGPDIHAVFTRQPDGSLAELKIHAPTENLGDLLGRVFYDLNVKDGLLVQTYQDTSGRKDPLVIKFRWNGKAKEFQAVDVQAAKRYHASFDCAKARTEVEKAVCDLSDVAFLDLKVDERYRRWLDQLSPADSDTLVQEQKAWLRKRDVICGEDWDIDHCLEELYRTRLRELDHFKSLHH
jgi:uncharacterized protein YecT (DUF1311 family)